MDSANNQQVYVNNTQQPVKGVYCRKKPVATNSCAGS